MSIGSSSSWRTPATVELNLNPLASLPAIRLAARTPPSPDRQSLRASISWLSMPVERVPPCPGHQVPSGKVSRSCQLAGACVPVIGERAAEWRIPREGRAERSGGLVITGLPRPR